ncbi:hypothetical protein [Streptomyces olivaceus]
MTITALTAEGNEVRHAQAWLAGLKPVVFRNAAMGGAGFTRLSMP